MYRLIEVGHLFTTVYWWTCALVGIIDRNIAARGSSRDAMMNKEANREISWVFKWEFLHFMEDMRRQAGVTSPFLVRGFTPAIVQNGH